MKGSTPEDFVTIEAISNEYACCPELIPGIITDWLHEEATNEELREAIDALEFLLEKAEEEEK